MLALNPNPTDLNQRGQEPSKATDSVVAVNVQHDPLRSSTLGVAENVKDVLSQSDRLFEFGVVVFLCAGSYSVELAQASKGEDDAAARGDDAKLSLSRAYQLLSRLGDNNHPDTKSPYVMI